MPHPASARVRRRDPSGVTVMSTVRISRMKTTVTLHCGLSVSVTELQWSVEVQMWFKLIIMTTNISNNEKDLYIGWVLVASKSVSQ